MHTHITVYNLDEATMAQVDEIQKQVIYELMVDY